MSVETSARVDVIVPVLHRPANVSPFMKSLQATTTSATAWFVCEAGDDVEQAAVRGHGGNVLVRSGTFSEKANHAWRTIPDVAPWIFLVGDDVVFHEQWLERAVAHAIEQDVAVCATNDLANWKVMAGRHGTHLLIASDYVRSLGASWDGPDILCHEGYRHWYVDNEIVAVAKQRRTFGAAPTSVVEHLHPTAGKAEHDSTYEAANSARLDDLVRYRRRARSHGAYTWRERVMELSSVDRVLRRWFFFRSAQASAEPSPQPPSLS